MDTFTGAGDNPVVAGGVQLRERVRERIVFGELAGDHFPRRVRCVRDDVRKGCVYSIRYASGQVIQLGGGVLKGRLNAPHLGDLAGM